MKKVVLLLSALCIPPGLFNASVLANCPAGVPNEIFCDDADTYCDLSNGGHPGDSKCPDLADDPPRNDQRLSEVWLREPRGGCGVEPIVEDDDSRLTSGPFGIKMSCGGDDQLGSATIRDWVHSPYPLHADGQVRNLSWRVEDTFGAANTAVLGTDDQPLVLQFMVEGATSGKIDWGNGYMEVTLDDGDESTKIDRANTDYADSPDCNVYCNPPLKFEPMPIICAQGNPVAGFGAMPSTCPNVETSPPPVRHSIAAGVLSLTDTDPCHCGSTTAHGPVSGHLTIYDGQKWWILRAGTPTGPGIVVTGGIAPRGGAPMPPPKPAEISTPGSFRLNGARNKGKSYNWVAITIKTATFDVQLTTQERDKSGNQYFVTSILTGMPRIYMGAFNALRMGVGQGCAIRGTPNNPWACGGSNTRCLRSRANSAGTLVYDDIYFHGGAPIIEEGACCRADGTCTDVLQTECDGVFRGRSTFCATLAQPCCGSVYGDTDGDLDVDMDDYGVFQNCIGEATLIGACRCLDGDGNGTINALDFNRFVGCSNGPDVLVEAGASCDGRGW